jgi:protein-disulfide isomerase
MSNRQARREQSRTSRTQRQARPAAPRSQKPSSGGSRGSGPQDLIRSPFALVVVDVVILFVAVLAFVTLRGGESSSSYVKILETAGEELPLELARENRLGQDSAPIKLTMFEDFQCPFCLRYTAEDEPMIVEEYVKTGKVQLIYEHLPVLGFESVRAAVASQCAADQNKFWQYHNRIFLEQARKGQDRSETVNKGRLSDDALKGFATEVGLDRAKFDQCFDTNQYLQDVQDDQARARSLGIGGTPSFLINGQPVTTGAPGTLDGWRKLLDDAVAQAGAAGIAPAASPTAAR